MYCRHIRKARSNVSSEGLSSQRNVKVNNGCLFILRVNCLFVFLFTFFELASVLNLPIEYCKRKISPSIFVNCCCLLIIRIVVRIDNWKTDSVYPCGHFIRSLGPIGDLETETSVILVEHSLLTLPFTEGQLREMPRNDLAEPWVIEEQEILKRKDLR